MKDLLDLDVVLREKKATFRVETSATLTEVTRCLSPQLKAGSIQPEKTTREGLGDWIAFGLRTKDLGILFVAAPDQDDDAGCSIWMKPSPKLRNAENYRKLVNFLSEKLVTLHPLFVRADTGEAIKPSPGNFATRTRSEDQPAKRAADKVESFKIETFS